MHFPRQTKMLVNAIAVSKVLWRYQNLKLVDKNIILYGAVCTRVVLDIDDSAGRTTSSKSCCDSWIKVSCYCPGHAKGGGSNWSKYSCCYGKSNRGDLALGHVVTYRAGWPSISKVLQSPHHQPFSCFKKAVYRIAKFSPWSHGNCENIPFQF